MRPCRTSETLEWWDCHHSPYPSLREVRASARTWFSVLFYLTSCAGPVGAGGHRSRNSRERQLWPQTSRWISKRELRSPSLNLFQQPAGMKHVWGQRSLVGPAGQGWSWRASLPDRSLSIPGRQLLRNKRNSTDLPGDCERPSPSMWGPEARAEPAFGSHSGFLSSWDLRPEEAGPPCLPPTPCCSVDKLCLTLCDPMDCSTPGFPVLHYVPDFAQTPICWVGDTIQQSCPLSSPFSSCPQSFLASGAFPMSCFFASGDQSIGASDSALVLPVSIQGWLPSRFCPSVALGHREKIPLPSLAQEAERGARLCGRPGTMGS